MFNGEEDFKFYIYEDQVFFLESFLLENNIQFHNELEYGTNIRTNKYYIKNSDRPKFDEICKENQIDIILDSIPHIETRFPKLEYHYSYVIAFVLFLLLFSLLFL